jgi:hypothetical protein
MIRDEFTLHGRAAVRLRMTAGDRSREWTFPVITTRPNPLAWQAALKIAGGDAKRLRAQPDGSVIVANS